MKNILKTLAGLGIDKASIQKIIDEKGVDEFLKNYKNLISGSLDALKDGFDPNKIKEKMSIGARQSTNIQEFNLGKRAKKTKGNHAVYAFAAELKKMIDDKKINIKANQPIKTIFKE